MKKLIDYAKYLRVCLSKITQFGSMGLGLYIYIYHVHHVVPKAYTKSCLLKNANRILYFLSMQGVVHASIGLWNEEAEREVSLLYEASKIVL